MGRREQVAEEAVMHPTPGARLTGSRKSKQAAGKPVIQKEKFAEADNSKVVELKPLNANQERYLQLIKSKQLVIAHGSSGTGKTFLACTHGANQLLKRAVERVVLVRPYEAVGRSVGLLPGDLDNKLTPLMQSMLQPLEAVLGSGTFRHYLEHGKIVLESAEFLRGRSYKNSLVIVDEAQNLDVRSIQTLVTRIDEGSQVILCGDGIKWQTDVKGDSGLNYLTKLLARLKKEKPDYLDAEDQQELYQNIGVVEFSREDVVRSGLTKMFVKVFDKEGI